MMRTTFACCCLIASLSQTAGLFADDPEQDPPAKQDRGAGEAKPADAPTPAMLVHAREMIQARQRMARMARRKWGRAPNPPDYFSNEDYMGYFYTGYRRPTPYPAYGPFPLYGAASDPDERTSSRNGR